MYWMFSSCYGEEDVAVPLNTTNEILDNVLEDIVSPRSLSSIEVMPYKFSDYEEYYNLLRDSFKLSIKSIISEKPAIERQINELFARILAYVKDCCDNNCTMYLDIQLKQLSRDLECIFIDYNEVQIADFDLSIPFPEQLLRKTRALYDVVDAYSGAPAIAPV